MKLLLLKPWLNVVKGSHFTLFKPSARMTGWWAWGGSRGVIETLVFMWSWHHHRHTHYGVEIIMTIIWKERKRMQLKSSKLTDNEEKFTPWLLLTLWRLTEREIYLLNYFILLFDSNHSDDIIITVVMIGHQEIAFFSHQSCFVMQILFKWFQMLICSLHLSFMTHLMIL